MNYNVQGITEKIPELFAMLKSAKVEIKKNIKCWWLTRPLVSSKRARLIKGTSRRMTSKLSLLGRNPKLDPSLKLSASTTKGLVSRRGTAPSIWQIRRMAKWAKVYLIYMLLMCTLLMLTVAPGYLILVLFLIFATRSRGYGLSEDWLRTRWRCTWEMVPKLMWLRSARYLYIYHRDKF